MTPAPLVISIQSQVVFGHVGNSAAVFPMQAAGLEVAAIPTVLLSNSPRHPTLRGRATEPELVADLLRGVRERGLPERAAYIVSGYIGSVEVALMTAAFVAEAKAANPKLIYLCDPVIGDAAPGLYVPAPIAEVMRDKLLPLADIATPNPFELSWLSDQPVASLADLDAARRRMPLPPQARLIVTGCALADTAPGQIESVLLTPEGSSRRPVPHLPIVLSGTGDLFAGLIVACLATGSDLRAAIATAQRLTSLALIRAEALGAREVVLSDPEFRRALLTLNQT